jgi:hypothetical protein
MTGPEGGSGKTWARTAVRTTGPTDAERSEA